jgi:hypothetical protein
MKYRTLPIIAALVVSLFTGCSKSGSTVWVISAVYGSGTNFADVSIRVSDLVHQESQFQAHPSWLKVDPSPGWNKALVVIYDVKGQRHIFTTGEGGRVSAAILLESARQ